MSPLSTKMIVKTFASLSAMLLIPVIILAQTEIGLQLYTFRNQIPKDVSGMLQKISNMGIREIEGGGTYGLPIDSFKLLLQKNNLKMISIGAGFKELDTNAQATVDRAKTFGAAYVTCTWIPHENGFTIDHAKQAVDVFNKAGKLLKENGISLVYHPHGYEFGTYEGNTVFDYMVKNMNPAYANFEMDVFWIKHPGQDPVALLKKYPKRFLLMHLKDRKPGTTGNQDGKADVESNVILGAGDVGIADIMREAPGAGVKHYFIEDESSRSEQQVPESLSFLKNLRKK
ncbi:MAG: sugar phosphate isomerase/epimerase [Chitinophagaceae bacterium]|nr:sugar phosphate isomerase/epimerase [Chitinophagaceae bacterium]